jgi:hypothetical protein
MIMIMIMIMIMMMRYIYEEKLSLYLFSKSGVIRSGKYTVGYRLVPAKRFLPKGSYQNIPAKKVSAKKAPETQRFLPKRSCQKGSHQKGSWKYRSWAIRFLSTRLPGPYGSCQKHSHVHMVPRSKWFPISFF